MQEYPETEAEIIDSYPEDISSLIGKNLVFHDIHHGTAYYLKRAKGKDIERLLSLLSPNGVVIVL